MNRNKKATIKSSASRTLLSCMAIMVCFYSNKAVLLSSGATQKFSLVVQKLSSKFVNDFKLMVVKFFLQIFFLCKSLSLFIKPLAFSRDGVSVQTNPKTAISWINLHFYKNPEPVVYMMQVLRRLHRNVDEAVRSYTLSCIDAMQNYRLHCNEEKI